MICKNTLENDKRRELLHGAIIIEGENLLRYKFRFQFLLATHPIDRATWHLYIVVIAKGLAICRSIVGITKLRGCIIVAVTLTGIL